jgi:hypothetical protein
MLNIAAGHYVGEGEVPAEPEFVASGNNTGPITRYSLLVTRHLLRFTLSDQPDIID